MMQTAEVQIVETVKTDLNDESINGIIAGAGLVIAGASIAMLTGGMTIDFPAGAKGLLPMLGILIGVTALFYFFMKARIISVTRTSKEVPIPTSQRSSASDAAPLDAPKIEDAASEQTAAGGDKTTPSAERPGTPKRDRERTRSGGKGREGNGSSRAPQDGKPGDGKPVDKKIPEDA